MTTMCLTGQHAHHDVYSAQCPCRAMLDLLANKWSALAIGALALAPSDPEILYVGTGEPSGSADSYFGVGLYRINNASTIPTTFWPMIAETNVNTTVSQTEL